MTCYRKGGCGPYEMLSCSECPASKPSYIMTKHLGCPLCNMKPIFDPEGKYMLRESTRPIACGTWTMLKVGKDKDDRLFIIACEDFEVEPYYPIYCPECGRWLGA